MREAPAEEEKSLMRTYYPKTAGMIQAMVEDACDRLDYEGSFFISFAESKNTPIGTRYFVTFLAKAPDRHLILDSVPSWFTLKAPDKGWKTLPTQKQLRIMMKDSSN